MPGFLNQVPTLFEFVSCFKGFRVERSLGFRAPCLGALVPGDKGFGAWGLSAEGKEQQSWHVQTSQKP